MEYKKLILANITNSFLIWQTKEAYQSKITEGNLFLKEEIIKKMNYHNPGERHLLYQYCSLTLFAQSNKIKE